MTQAKCRQCGALLTHDEAALYQRLVDRGARRFLCLDCLSRAFGCSRSVLEDKIRYFRAVGCMLFRLMEQPEEKAGEAERRSADE